MDKNICSHCHKLIDKDQFFRANWKNTAERYFKICNTCNRNKKLTKLNDLVNKLDEDVNIKYNYIDPEKINNK